VLSPGTVISLSANTSWYLFNFRKSTIARLLALGCRVVCLAPEDEYSDRLEQLGCEWYPLSMDNGGSNPVRDAALLLQLSRYYRRIRPAAALHFTVKNNVYGTWAARLFGVPAINNVSGLGTAFIRSGWVSFVVRVLYRASQPFAAFVFCQNEEDQRLLVDRQLVPVERLALLPGSGVDLHRFNPSLRRGHDGDFRFLYAGRMLADKGLRELCEAIRQLREEGYDAMLWLCGFSDVSNVSAISVAELEQWGQEPCIEWLGPTDAIEGVLAEVDCVVLPSYREGLPRSLLEAGAMGLPVVATDVPGCRHVIEDGVNGLLCAPRDTASLKRALVRMLTLSEPERDALGAQGRSVVEERFSEARVIDATVAAISTYSRR
jgi:glycosyltransferase involved in cell wall biosynthesis